MYTRTIDTTDTGTMIWENIFDCDDPPCSVTINTACWGLRHQEWGWIYGRPAHWDATTSQFVADFPSVSWRVPDRVTVNYKAGFPLDSDTNTMDYTHALAVAKLATALMPTRACGCKRSEQRIVYYQDLPMSTMGGRDNVSEVAAQTMERAGAAFGNMKRGAIEAFIALEDYIIGQGTQW